MNKNILVIAMVLTEILLVTSMISAVQAWTEDCTCDHYDHEQNNYPDDEYTAIGMWGVSSTAYWLFERGYGGTYPPIGQMYCHWRVDYGDYNYFTDWGSTWDWRAGDPYGVYYQNATHDYTASYYASGLTISAFIIPASSPPQSWWCGSTWAVITN